ncbi:TetR/AcrR family transcriptional regulator [Gordonia sp. ABSL1-1]|uniref:TetR/AcrR family transcriptional regulator n=1 Tax=Gordonia sp. ABSL1-1 TaxID=3053923 RepID=UPI002573C994|nr:TetR/AcrR family transcriptional regulator [Gordonia sp. ABSL1-1]MDL9935275.1 TetR/AcrR family transcriptional regulator [Gordonia sp. ABSL1-1]
MPDTPTRSQMVAGAAELLGRRGLRAASIRELAKSSGAPLGSTYHYFPDGKVQLVTEAVRFADELTVRTLAAALDNGPVAGLRAFVEMWRRVVVGSDFRAGCPVLAVSVQEPDEGVEEPLRSAAAAFERWTELLTQSLRDHGADAEHATRVATLIVAALEGTVAICRAQRSITALDVTAAALEDAIRAAIR